jgi:hypothetical protein
MDILNETAAMQLQEMEKAPNTSRRRFFQLAGGIAGAGLILSACKGGKPTDIFVGSGETGLLNYLYILQQLEAAFYTQAVATPYYGMDKSEQVLLTDLRDQEIGHREFFQKKLGADAIRDIVINFSAVTFADRTSVLHHSKVIEDLVVSGMNGVVELFTTTDYILTVSKMCSVEARHAAYARDLGKYNSFGDSTVIASNGLDQAASPSTVMASAKVYIQSGFDITKLPTY